MISSHSSYDWGKPKPKGWQIVPRRAPSYVYFIAPQHVLRHDFIPQVVKIGVTSGDPMSRLATFQTGSPCVLDLIACVEGDESLERALHAALINYRMHGEWFILKKSVDAMMRRFDEILGWTPNNSVLHQYDFAEIIAEHLIDAPAVADEEDPFGVGDLNPLIRWFKSIGLVRP